MKNKNVNDALSFLVLALIAGALLVTLSGCGKPEQSAKSPFPVQTLSWADENTAIRDFLIAKAPDLATTDVTTREFSVRVMSLLHWADVYHNPNSNLYYETRLSNIQRVFDDSANYGHICGGLALTLVDMLQAFGVTARFVGLYNNDNWHSHAVVEILIDGVWNSFDPTYNAQHFTPGGQPITFRQIRDSGFQYTNVYGAEGVKYGKIEDGQFAYANYFDRVEEAAPGYYR